MELSEELIAKAKGTKTPEELAALAKESSIDLTEEDQRHTLNSFIRKRAS